MSRLRTRIGALSAGLCCLLATYVVAQQTESREDTAGRAQSSQFDRSDSEQAGQSATQQNRRSSQRAGQTQSAQRGASARAGGQSEAVEQYLAACLLNKNQSEIELSRFAQQQSQNSEVKQFAQQMVQDHQQLSQQLQQLAGGQIGASTRTSQSQSLDATSQRESQRQASDTTRLPGSSGAGQTGRGAATNDSEALTDTSAQGTRTSQSLTATSSSSGNGAIQQLMQIDRQIVERQGQMVKEELQQKQGPEFDKAFLSIAVNAHVHMLAALETIQQQGQGQLAQVAQQAQPVVQQHLDHAKQLMEQQKRSGASGAEQAERPASRTQR